LTSLVRDYDSYRDQRDVSFIAVNMSRTADIKTVQRQADEYGLKPFPIMLDAGGMTAAAYDVPINEPNWLVILDHEGQVIYNASKGWYWTSGPNANRKIHEVQIEEALAVAPGILQDDVPKGMELVAHYFDLRQFHLVEEELERQLARQGDSEHQAFADALRERIDQERQARVQDIRDLADREPLRAFREAISFVKAFPKAPERREVNRLGRELMKADAVAAELKAERAFREVMVPLLRKHQDPGSFRRKVRPAADAFSKHFQDTEFAEVAAATVEAHSVAVRGGN